ncbi:hypothetical protein LBMAG33_5440 [Candidatus Levyibacteriota bacterium]|nr:hypothetical protein LBMAG33_5440 [Candidatus Levybacteria bacterium]
MLSKLTNIYLIIPEFINKFKVPKAINFFYNWKSFLRYLGIGLSLIILLAICFGIVNIFILQKKKSAIEIKRREIYMQISHWQKIENKYSGYRDANFTLAALEYQLGDYVKAKFYLNKALLLDPNFELGRKLEKKLQ